MYAYRYVCVYIYIMYIIVHICMYVCMYLCMHACMYVRTCVYSTWSDNSGKCQGSLFGHVNLDCLSMSQFRANRLESACLLLGVQMRWGSLLCCIFVELRRLRSTCHQWKVPLCLQQLPGRNDMWDTERVQSSSYQKLLRDAECLLKKRIIASSGRCHVLSTLQSCNDPANCTPAMEPITHLWHFLQSKKNNIPLPLWP